MSLNNKSTSFGFIPYQQPPIRCARDLPLPKRRSKNVNWEKSRKYQPTKQGKSEEKVKQLVATTTLYAATSPLSSPITSESASSNTDSCQADSVTVNSLDKGNADSRFVSLQSIDCSSFECK